ncbi:unnamed protein product [Cuscuta epithymum]|uniref:Uncharacterized protein n=1 Tax=Cuscuta epithymum TaxID=186058 RepID=A0AAV0FH01_9ASTE|nr:unnamed protein product [Cuscuta epithymum]
MYRTTNELQQKIRPKIIRPTSVTFIFTKWGWTVGTQLLNYKTRTAYSGIRQIGSTARSFSRKSVIIPEGTVINKSKIRRKIHPSSATQNEVRKGKNNTGNCEEEQSNQISAGPFPHGRLTFHSHTLRSSQRIHLLQQIEFRPFLLQLLHALP